MTMTEARAPRILCMKNVVAMLCIAALACASVAAAKSNKEVERLEQCGEVLKEILDIPDNLPTDLLNDAECVIVFPSVKKFAMGVGGSYGWLIAPDLIGMGDSDKIPAGAEPDRYRFASHARYVDAFIDEVVGTEPLTLVLHDWGGALGFDWAYRHQQRVRAIAYMETFVAPLTLEDLPESFRPTLKAVRSSAGEALVLSENMFIEKMLPGVTQRTLSADEMAEYRRPFLEAGDDRWPTMQWAREVPLSGEPADVHDRIAAYSAWLKTASLPKLFIAGEPGLFITGRIRRLASSFPNQHRIVVGGLHFVQEDTPDEIGRAIANWLEHI